MLKLVVVSILSLLTLSIADEEKVSGFFSDNFSEAALLSIKLWHALTTWVWIRRRNSVKSLKERKNEGGREA